MSFFLSTSLFSLGHGKRRISGYGQRFCMSAKYNKPSQNICMKIFRAIGLGLAIIIVSFLMPEVFGALEDVLLTFFQLLNTILTQADESFTNGDLFVPASINLVP